MPLITDYEQVKDTYAQAAEMGVALPAFCAEDRQTLEAILASALEMGKEIGVENLPIVPAWTGRYPVRSQATLVAACGDAALGTRLMLSDLEVLTGEGSPYRRLRVLPHLDHAFPWLDADLMEDFADRFASVMCDASERPFDENIKLTAEYAERMRGRVLVEGAVDELAEAGEDGPRNEPTTVAQAQRFVRDTGVDLIVPNVGTEHRATAEQVAYRRDRAREISTVVGKVLCLHGTSSVKAEDLPGLPEDGFVKINIFTTLAVRGGQAVARRVLEDLDDILPEEELRGLVWERGTDPGSVPAPSTPKLAAVANAPRRDAWFGAVRERCEEFLRVFGYGSMRDSEWGQTQGLSPSGEIFAMMRFMACLAYAIVCQSALAQETEAQTYWTYGTREIDKLPKSNYAEPLWGQHGWYYQTSEEPAEPKLAIHLKPSFRVGAKGMERLCVIEAATPENHRQHGIIRYECQEWGQTQGLSPLTQRIGWLAPKAQYRAIWLPVTPSAVRATLITNGEALARADCVTAEDAPAGLFEVEAPNEPLYVDHGYGLMPAWQVMAHPGQGLRVRFATWAGFAGRAVVRGELREGGNERAGYFERRQRALVVRPLPGARGIVTQSLSLPRETVWEGEVATAGMRPGKYTLVLEADMPGGIQVRDAWGVTLVERTREQGFGAHYADLRYTAPVHVSLEETKPWDELWQGSSLRDVVVSFPNAPYRFVFWRGTSYVPCWAFNNTWLTYEWFEAEPDFHGAIGCVEPIMDKGCRYSRATIISATDARVVVYWRYGLTDFAQKVINNEWADEYYYLYPDAVGTRKLIGWMKSGWHENQEFIALNRPGNAPHKSLEAQAVTLLTTDGRSERAVWPRPFMGADGWPHIIAKVNIPGQPSPFMVVDDDDAQIKVWSEPYVDKPGLFNTYLHWPVSRGIRTTWLDDPKDWERPTHTNLINIVHDEAVREDDHRIWYWLIGVARNERDLRAHAASWLDAGTVEVAGGVSEGYDKSQRAYLIKADPTAQSLRVSVQPGDAPIVNPAFVISGAGPWLSEVHCAGAKRVEIGRERDGKDLVVWVEGRFAEGMRVRVR